MVLWWAQQDHVTYRIGLPFSKANQPTRALTQSDAQTTQDPAIRSVAELDGQN